MIVKSTKISVLLITLGSMIALSLFSASTSALQNSSDIKKGIMGTTYIEYLKEHNNAIRHDQTILVLGKDYSNSDTKLEIKENFNESAGSCVLTLDEGFIEWVINIPNEGLYNIEMKYFPISGKGGNIERELYIDGKIPFNEAKFLTFSRMWRDKENEFKQDNVGNQIRPIQEERAGWMKSVFMDPNGYVTTPLQFYFSKGRHNIKMSSVREPMAIEYLKLFKSNAIPKYDDYKLSNNNNPVNKVTETIYIDAEKAYNKSTFSIFPYSDTSSGSTQPQDPYRIKLNCLGGTKWQTPGQWISWKFKVDKSGYYWVAPRYRQNIHDGLYISRKFMIDGEVPFNEANQIVFKFSTDWQLKPLGDSTKSYEFYFDAGEHEISMEVVLGDFAEILGVVDNSIYELNSIYRNILMITGATPDVYRDYGFDTAIPETISSIKIQADILNLVSKKLEKITGKKGEYVVMIDKVVFQLMGMYNKPETIAQNFTIFKSNIGALGTWILTARQQPLELDYIKILPVGSTLPMAEGNFFERFSYSVQTFIASFIVDYNKVGEFGNDKKMKSIDVWIATGRDQAQIIKGLSDDSFTSQKNINVNLKLVAPGTLLPSVLAGIGPDVSLSNPNTDPINYATRKAVMDLSKFKGFDEVIKRFSPQAMTPYQFSGGTYALPETLQFPMMFYRKDIFNELQLSPPKTWDEFYRIIPELQKRNMEIGFPPTFSGLQILLYQAGGEIYSNDRKKSTLENDLTIDAFKKFTQLFTVYKLPVIYDFANRFRTGEMPLGIADYTLYNQLTVFAPEIRGLWEFVPLPATKRSDGTMSNVSPATSTGPTSCTGVMMLKGSRNTEAAWEFIDWWTSDQTQSGFGNEMEVVLGVAAKQPTANISVLKKLPWSASEFRNLSEQYENIIGTPEIPGGYYIPRNIDFAFNNVYNNGVNPTKELLSYIRTVNEEITRKRIEFGLK